MVHFTAEELEEYRAKKAAEKAEAQKEAAKTEEVAAKQRRQDLEDGLKARFITSGGTAAEWLTVKKRIIEDALVMATLNPEPEPDTPKAPAPMSRRQYLDR